jgi:hypothetical protein
VLRQLNESQTRDSKLFSKNRGSWNSKIPSTANGSRGARRIVVKQKRPESTTGHD